jgi:hypothetical protein
MNENLNNSETAKKDTKKRFKKIPNKQSRSLQISMSFEQQTLIRLLAVVCRCSISEILKVLVSPYTDFIRDVMKEENLINEYGTLNTSPDEALEYVANQISENNNKYLDKIKGKKNEDELDFPFMKGIKFYD